VTVSHGVDGPTVAESWWPVSTGSIEMACTSEARLSVPVTVRLWVLTVNTVTV
jgi:hypothetical protein